MLEAEQIVENFTSITKLIDIKVIDPEKNAAIKALYAHFADRLTMCPASVKQFYAYPGGLIAHKLKVITNLGLMVKVWRKLGDI